MRKRWRCFHCDAVFASEADAGIHFGADEAATCAYVLPHEQHLVERIRDLERQLGRYRIEDGDVMRSIRTLEGSHRQALRRAEEDGYARGVRDATREQLATVGGLLARLDLLLAAAHADDPKREILVRIGDLMRDARALARKDGSGTSDDRPSVPMDSVSGITL